MITTSEITIARKCIEIALSKGADAIRVSLNKCVSDSVTILNGEVDKVAHSADRSLYLYVFADKRYGTFSTNRIELEGLESFIGNAVEMVRMLGEDHCRRLPEIERTERNAVTGNELGLYDSEYLESNSDSRLARALSISIFNKPQESDGYTVISEECEYTDSYDDTFMVDSQGFEGRHTETTFSAFCETTIADNEGNKFSGFWWENAPYADQIEFNCIAKKALSNAVRQIGAKARKGGRYKMVVDRNTASRLISPLFTALNASSIQQKMSFLEDTLDKKVFSEGLTLMDMARTPGKAGSRLFDTEGVATSDAPIIEKGVVKRYFVNTYMSEKMGIAPTVEDISRPCMEKYIKGENLSYAEKDVSLEDILKLCRSGIYVTGFNGGNCNHATGDFSYGVEGFAFKDGKVTHPVREMLITGNIIELWSNLLAVGSDARRCSRWQIPTIAFENVSFSS